MSENGEKAIQAAFDQAEVVTNPLEGLVERAKSDPGAAFAPDVLEALADLRIEDRSAYETLRNELRKAGVRVAELEAELPVPSPAEITSKSRPLIEPVDPLTDLGLFHAPDRKAYADAIINGRRETMLVDGQSFAAYLRHRNFELSGRAMSSEEFSKIVKLANARAIYGGPQHEVHLRVAAHQSGLYIDLGDVERHVVEVAPVGWRVITDPPVRFVRPKSLRALPMPTRGGHVDLLRRYLNIADDHQFVLAICWVLAALRPSRPYPVLVLSGEQGSAKSTFSRIMKVLVDPSAAPLRSASRDERDLHIAASNAHVLVLDNLSAIPGSLSDALCRLATGGGFATRQLYTDHDETIFDAMRPTILNGIEDVVTRPDLADRAIFLMLRPIDEKNRRPEDELWAEFEADRPAIFGALLDAMAHGLKRLPEIRLERAPRMADFAKWATACETAFGPQGTFAAAYAKNRSNAADNVIEADPVASCIRSLMSTCGSWVGSATNLHSVLARGIDEATRKSRAWPSTPSQLSGRLRRATTVLRSIGIEIEMRREGHARDRIIRITRADTTAAASADGPEDDGGGPDPADVPS